MLDEKSLRRETWEEESGSWVTFADGQAWLLPKPWVRRRPTRVNGVLQFGASTEYGAEFDAMLKAVEDDWTQGNSELAISLLQRNYDLTEDQIYELLVIDSRSTRDWRNDVYSVANGFNAPKPSSGGDE